jgi:hypothetical protein
MKTEKTFLQNILCSAKDVKDCVPSYKDVENDLMEANMSDTELYFGSEANYLHYKYGN